jgi:cell division transport system permease protein
VLGLQAGLADRLLPVVVAAMSFLAALALAGALATATLAARWQGDAAATLTVQIPNPEAAAADGKTPRLAAVLAALQAAPAVRDPHRLSGAALNRLLAPWLGGTASDLGLALPAVIAARWQGGDSAALAARLDRIAPGTLLERGAAWAARVAALTASLQACAVAILGIVALVAATMVALAIHSLLAQRRETIEIVHGLGALDADIANRFAARTTALAAAGAAVGVLAALPVLLWLAALAAPFTGFAGSTDPGAAGLPGALWGELPALPLFAAGIGWLTAQLTVRGWLRRRV